MTADNTLGTVTVLDRENIGSQGWVLATVSVGTHYPSGGKPLTAAHFGLDAIATVIVVEQCSLAAPTKVVVYDRANAKLAVLVFDGSNAEDSNDSDNSATIATLLVRGY